MAPYSLANPGKGRSLIMHSSYEFALIMSLNVENQTCPTFRRTFLKTPPSFWGKQLRKARLFSVHAETASK